MKFFNLSKIPVLQVIAIAACYFIAARIGLLLAYEHTNASPVWPPSGLAFAIVLVLGYRKWPGIWLGAFVANAVVFTLNNAAPPLDSISMSFCIATGNTLEALIGAYLFRRFVSTHQLFDKYQNIFWFLGAALIASLVSATIGVNTLLLGNIITRDIYLDIWHTWLLGDLAGFVIVSPLIIAWFLGRKEIDDKSLWYRVEFIANIVLLIIAAFFVFMQQEENELVEIHPYMLLPFLIWGAFRLKQREVVALLVVVSVFAVLGTIHGKGPFADLDLNESLTELQTFVTIVNISFLALSASVAEQRIITKRLRDSGIELEESVRERTAELEEEIEDHQRSQRELISIKNEFERACKIAHLGHWRWDIKTNSIYWSDELYNLFETTRDIFDGTYETYLTLLHPEDKEMVTKCITSSFTNKTNFNFFHRILRANGQIRWLHSQGEVILDASGTVVKMMGSAFDVTEIKEKEHLNAYLASILEFSADAIISKSLDGNVTSWNKGAENLFGYTEQEIIGRPVTLLFPPHKLDEEKWILSKIAAGETVTQYETTRVTKDRRTLSVSVTTSPLKDANGKITGASKIVRDITDRKEKEDTRFRLIVDSAPNVMILVNKDGLIELINSEGEKMFGYKREELVGKGIEILLPERFRAPHPEHRHGFFIQPEVRAMGAGRELFALHKSGEEIPVEIGLNPIETPDGVMVLAAIIDITERKKIEEARREREIVQETVRLKDQFLANMSHEIRTPMNAIVGFTELLDRSTLDAEQKDYVYAIKSSGNTLLTIINDILDLSKIQAGKVQLESVPVDITSLLHSLREMFSLKAKEKGLALNFNYNREQACLVMGDPVRLSQILINLISNAIKFTETGMVNVSMKIEHEDTDHYMVHFSIQDTGIGIHKDKIRIIFERFIQASTDITRKFGGTGLGLSIVRSLVELHNGSVSVKSKINEGSTFDIMINFNRCHDFVETPKVIIYPEPHKDEKIKVMLVEDNKLNQKLAITVLNKEGINVDLAETGEEAIHKIMHNTYDVVLMDIQMPVMDGYSATQIIRNELNLTVPIIAMTAHAFAGERERCLGYGMTDYISKPFKREDLIEKIYEAVHRQAKTE